VAEEQSSEENKRQKRRLRPTTSIREQSEKAQIEKPRRIRKAARAFSKPLLPIGRFLARLGRFKPLRIMGYILVPPYFRNAFKELRQVTWPNGSQTRQLTLAVIIFALIFGLIVAGVDYGLDNVFKKVILKQGARQNVMPKPHRGMHSTRTAGTKRRSLRLFASALTVST